MGVFGLLLADVPMLAHHSVVGYYDVSTQITLKGVVTKVEYTNPHAYVYLDVKDEKGNVEKWSIETDSPSVLTRSGWKRTTLKEGDAISATGFPAKDHTKSIRLQKLVMADGTQLHGGNS
jgi:DNA/RNA endonuclease YhcR with UshA esterase domain